MTPLVAVIGAGFSGLAMARALQKRGQSYVVLEASAGLGGNWYDGVHEELRLVTSKESTQFPEFPFPNDVGYFPSGDDMLTYLNAYADACDLRSSIQTESRVTSIAPCPGGFLLHHARGVVEASEVVVANGHHWNCKYPAELGNYGGTLIHAKSFRDLELYNAKRVCVVGAGNAGVDAVVAASTRAKALAWSVREPTWILPKTIGSRSTVDWLQRPVPTRLQEWMLVRESERRFGSLEDHGLRLPVHRPFSRHPTLSDDVLPVVRRGLATAYPGPVRAEGKTIFFADGRSFEADLVLAATGYEVAFPFLPDGMVSFERNLPRLVLGSMVPRQRGLFVLGLGQPRSGAGSLLRPGAELLADFIALERSMGRCLADALAVFSPPSADSLLVDPRTLRVKIAVTRAILRGVRALYADSH